jgi:hypothetical protein
MAHHVGTRLHPQGQGTTGKSIPEKINYDIQSSSYSIETPQQQLKWLTSADVPDAGSSSCKGESADASDWHGALAISLKPPARALIPTLHTTNLKDRSGAAEFS